MTVDELIKRISDLTGYDKRLIPLRLACEELYQDGVSEGIRSAMGVVCAEVQVETAK